MSRDKTFTLLRHCEHRTGTISIHDNNDLTEKVEIHGDFMTNSKVDRIGKTLKF